MKEKDKVILVTGGAGFVGSSLIKSLISQGYKNVYSLDNYFTGHESTHVDGATYIRGDTKDIFERISFSPDVVYHFGEYARVFTSFEDVQLAWKYNCEGTFKVVEFCRRHNSKLIYSASSTKFGNNGENRNESPYAFFKSQNSTLIKNYGDWYNLDYTICYFYNVYGAGQISTGKYATVIGIFEEQYKNNKPLTVVSPGTQKRDFTHVDDITSGLLLLLNKGSGDGYCFGTGSDYSILEVAQMFKDEYILLPSREGERFDSGIDLSKSHDLGWKAQKNIKDYILQFKSDLE